MKKLLSILSLALIGNFAAQAQTETFTASSVPSEWSTPNASYTLSIVNKKLLVTMVDSIGPQQLPVGVSPAANWNGFEVNFPSPIDMTTGCQCITFDIDNTGNAATNFSIQAQDNSGSPNHYTDQTAMVIAAGYKGSVTIDYTGKFENYYGYPSAGGLIDGTQIAKLIIQPVGDVLTAAPWTKKFKGNFKLDNFTVAGSTLSTNAAQANVASTNLYPNPVTDVATVELKQFASSQVKVTLSDVMGKEVMTITEGTFQNVSKEFSVSNLNKGIYTVNYFINGASAKSELLMVK